MSETPPLGELPPDLPPEYAEAYRRGFERAYREASRGALDDTPEPTPPGTGHRRDDGRGKVGDTRLGPIFDRAAESPRRKPREAKPARPEPDPNGSSVWLVPVLLLALVAVLLLLAYAIGRVFASTVADSKVSHVAPAGGIIPHVGHRPSRQDGRADPAKPPSKPYAGPTAPATIATASASCQAPPAVDAAGHPVSYAVGNVYDGDLSTAWRCDGRGVGQSVTLDLPAPTEIGRVGLVPGYAKTDPVSGADRYRENDRITRVRWTFSDGTRLVQRFDGSPDRRSMQSLRIPKTTAQRVRIEILSSTPGPRDTVAISEVRLGAVAH